MTFREMLAADMTTLTDADVFGESVTYVTPSGAETSLAAVVFDERTETPENNGVSTKKRMRDCTFPTSSVSSVNLRAKVQIGSVDWSIEQVVFRDDTQTTVLLVRHEVQENTRPRYRRKQ